MHLDSRFGCPRSPPLFDRLSRWHDAWEAEQAELAEMCRDASGLFALTELVA